MELARTSAREAAGSVQSRIKANLYSVMGLAGAMATTKAGNLPLLRPQIDAMVKSTLVSSPDFVGAAVTWEPNALDGKDAEFAGKAPEYDATGRHMPYWTRKPGGAFHVDPIVFDPAPGANDWYDIPRKTRKDALIEPYIYPVAGKDVLMTTMVTPVLVGGQFAAAVEVHHHAVYVVQVFVQVFQEKDLVSGIYVGTGAGKGVQHRQVTAN